MTTSILKKRARSIQILERNSEGGVTVTELATKKRKHKDSSWARPYERNARFLLRAIKVYAEDALSRHDRSRGKKRNGWLVEFGRNHGRAVDKAFKILRKI